MVSEQTSKRVMKLGYQFNECGIVINQSILAIYWSTQGSGNGTRYK